MFWNVWALPICLVNSTLGEYIFVRKSLQMGSLNLQISWKLFRDYKPEF